MFAEYAGIWYPDLGNLQGLQKLENFEYNKGNQYYNNPEDTYYHFYIQLFQDLYNLGNYHEIQKPYDQFQSIQYSVVLDSVNSLYVQDHNQDAYDASYIQFFHNDDFDNYYIHELCDYDLNALLSDSNNGEEHIDNINVGLWIREQETETCQILFAFLIEN
ncbi:39422_t:CDS:2, partial [Gigaspora margarita]